VCIVLVVVLVVMLTVLMCLVLTTLVILILGCFVGIILGLVRQSLVGKHSIVCFVRVLMLCAILMFQSVTLVIRYIIIV